MRKITLKLLMVMFLFGTYSGVAQTLNQAASWPNAAWTLSGTYTAGGLLSDPTGAGATFTWDDDGAGNGSNDDIIATSPVIDLTAAAGAGETWITIASEFTYRPLSGDILIIETYDADAMTWSTLFTYVGNSGANDYQTCANTVAYTTPVLDISGFSATQLSGFQYRISYDDTDDWNWGWCITSPTITSGAPPSCIDPSMLTATNLTDTTADLGWTENGTATAWDIELVTNGTPATGTPTASGVMNPYAASSLMADTLYDFYVRADCGVAGTSSWIGPFTFRTACAPINAPYTEDFETFTTAATAFVAENCWSATGGLYFWESAPGTDTGSGGTGPSPTITTGNYFYTEASAGNPGDVTDLVSPLVDLAPLTAPSLTFNYHMFGADMGTLDVLVNGATNVWSLSGQQQTSDTAPWEQAVVDLSAFAGQAITVTFRATSAGIFEGDISIDNVSFDELPACPDPSALGVTNVTDTTADLGWTESGSATTWDIEIVDVTAGGTATGTPTTAGVMTNPYTAMGLTENNDYAFYVRSDCGGGTFSGWVGPFNFTTLETCPAPSGLNTANVTETSADLGWTENGTATSWDIEVVDVTAGGTATGTPTATGVMTNPYAATGLVGDNAYEFYVRADCGVDGTSAWAGPFAFSTPYVAVPPTCTSGIFLDSGGNSGDYSSNENITYTICPDMAGDGVNVEFTFFSIENNGATGCWDELTIHDGPDALAPTIDSPNGPGWCWDRNDTPSEGSGDLQGQTIVSTDASGCLTFVFTSDTSVTRPGWSANITCSPLSIASAEVRGFVHYVNKENNSFVVNAQSTIASIEVYNLVGQIITTAEPNAAAGEAYLSSAKNGVYFARVTLENGNASVVKFVK